ncbi:MAG: hypothetical protein ACI865_002911 [Flavobacteriaceae bacterium]|jgi:hypothetical protein
MKFIYSALFILVLISCKKKETCSDGILNQDEILIDCGGACNACPISYPAEGSYGVNLLSGVDTLKLPGTGNSLRAVIPEGSSLKIEMISLSGTWWAYSLGSGDGWSVSTYANNSQTFEALNGGVTDLHIVKAFIGAVDTGTVLIRYLENGSTVTREKILIWE